MDGREVHRWESDIKGSAYERMLEMLPHYIAPWNEGWAHFEMAENGDLIVMGCHHMLARLDWDSHVLWKLDITAHHDLRILNNGDIVVLVDKLRLIEVDDTPTLFLDNEIVFITHDGQLMRRISLFDALGGTMRTQVLQDKIAVVNERPFAERFKDIFDSFGSPEAQDEKEMAKVARLYDRALTGSLGDDEEMLTMLLHNQKEDVFHSNSIQELDRTIPGLWRKGDLLITIRDLDTVVVIDHESERVIWSWGEEDIQRPHHATYLTDGTILIFDNGAFRNYSRIIT